MEQFRRPTMKTREPPRTRSITKDSSFNVFLFQRLPPWTFVAFVVIGFAKHDSYFAHVSSSSSEIRFGFPQSECDLPATRSMPAPRSAMAGMLTGKRP
jgi:hypothetical protein